MNFKIDFDESQYTIMKVRDKKENTDCNYPVMTGMCGTMDIGDKTVLMLNGIDEWFRSSYIMDVTKEGDDLVIETKNSIYLLRKRG